MYININKRIVKKVLITISRFLRVPFRASTLSKKTQKMNIQKMKMKKFAYNSEQTDRKILNSQ